jgi:hypothetical protein
MIYASKSKGKTEVLLSAFSEKWTRKVFGAEVVGGAPSPQVRKNTLKLHQPGQFN